jgi:hypothetical protein
MSVKEDFAFDTPTAALDSMTGEDLETVTKHAATATKVTRTVILEDQFGDEVRSTAGEISLDMPTFLYSTGNPDGVTV